MLKVLNQLEIIQSRMDYGVETTGFRHGVKISPLKDIFDELLISRVPLDSIDDMVPEGKEKLVIRRWYVNL